MADFLDTLAQNARITIDSGYYDALNAREASDFSLKQGILKTENAPVITEIKAASPSAGAIRKNLSAGSLAKSMEKGGAVGLSVLT